MSDILILGDGKLGTEIRNQTGWDYISRNKNHLDFRDIDSYRDLLLGYNQILNCIGYTNTYSDEKQEHWDINFKGVISLVDICEKRCQKLIQISTDYIYSGSDRNANEEKTVPVSCNSWYGYTKLLADGYIQCKSNSYLIIRTSFKPSPFPYPQAIIQYGSFDYIDVIASLIIKLIEKKASGVYNVGTKTKSMHDLAKQTNPKVILTYKKIHDSMPKDITMDTSKMRVFLNG